MSNDQPKLSTKILTPAQVETFKDIIDRVPAINMVTRGPEACSAFSNYALARNTEIHSEDYKPVKTKVLDAVAPFINMGSLVSDDDTEVMVTLLRNS